MAERNFSISRDPWDNGECIYKNNCITIRPGITVLVGCNGAGKSTLIRQMKQQLITQNIPMIAYDNLNDGGDRAKSSAGFFGDIQFLATAILSSEGENIMMNIGNFVKKLGAFMRRNQDASEMWVFLDAVDSGFSIDNIDECKHFLYDVVLKDAADRNVYIVISANAYEFARGEACFDVQSGLYVQFYDYEDYRNFVLNTRAEKDARERKVEE